MISIQCEISHSKETHICEYTSDLFYILIPFRNKKSEVLSIG